MTVKIGEKIKDLRKKADVTQERFAEYLGVSPQAVSKWEVEGCYPDLELLAPIANFFSVTIDELMGFDTAKNQERINEIFTLMNEKSNKGLLKDELEIVRNAVAEFPNHYELLYHLVVVLRSIRTDTDEERQKNLRESIAISERILADCTDDGIREGVLQQLAFSYQRIGEKEKAVATARKLGYMYCSWNEVLTSIYEGDELYKLLVSNISDYTELLTLNLMKLGHTKYGNDLHKKVKVYQKAVDLFALIYEAGDYGFNNSRLAEYYMDMARSYIVLGDVDNTLICLEKCAEYAVAYDTSEKMTHTSVIFEGIKHDPAGSMKDYDYNDCYMYLNACETNENFACLKDDERYKAVLAKLKKYAKKESD